MKKSQGKEAGFVMMILLVIMVVGASVYFGNFAENFRFQNQNSNYQKEISRLNKIKQKLLNYAVFQPEIFQQENNGNNKDTSDIPSPGYFMCPDMDGDGSLSGETTCGDSAAGFTYGFLPTGIVTRNIFFPEVSPREYYFVVADKFHWGNTDYNSPKNRYAPLNTDVEAPNLKLDDNGEYVVLIIYPGGAQNFPDGFSQDRAQPGDAQTVVQNYLDRRFDSNHQQLNGNADGDEFFYSNAKANLTINDIVVGITFEEWKLAVKQRIDLERIKLCGIAAEENHWFNAYDATDNPVGAGWRDLGEEKCQ